LQKITDTDSFIAKEYLKTGKKKNANASSFSKQDNLLRSGDNASFQSTPTVLLTV
jgi:hypothetical protein